MVNLRLILARLVGAVAVLAVVVVGARADLAPNAPDHAAATVNTATSRAAAPTIDELAQGRQDGDAEVRVAGPVQVNFRRLTFQPGASTGEHCHYGRLVGVVEKGTLTHYASIYPGGVHVYHAGDTINEGPGYVHEGVNEARTPLVLYVTYLTPEGKPLAETDLSNCDAA